MKKNVRKAVGALCIVIALCCIGYIIYYNVKKADNNKIYEKVQKEVTKQKAKAPKKTEAYVSPIDFAQLQNTNPDIYAWIEIPGTNVNYPIVQSATDNAYYLDHTIEGVQGYPGSIYTENFNTKEFTDFNTVIYGHNMKDGSMFQNLHNYEDPAYMEQNSQLIIYTPDKKRTYEIFAAVVYDDTHILNDYDFTQEAQRFGFLQSVSSAKSMSGGIREGINVTPDSNILTLSTCIGDQPNNRFIVEAVLQNVEE